MGSSWVLWGTVENDRKPKHLKGPRELKKRGFWGHKGNLEIYRGKPAEKILLFQLQACLLRCLHEES